MQNLYIKLYQDEPERLVFTGTDNQCMEWFLKNTNYSYYTKNGRVMADTVEGIKKLIDENI